MDTMICPACGAEVAAGKKYCTECGAPLPAACGDTFPRQEPSAEAPAETAAACAVATEAAPVQERAPEPEYRPAPQPEPDPEPKHKLTKDEKRQLKEAARLEPVSTWGFVGCILLMSIPVLGWLIAIIWALGGCRKVNKRNLARANLLLLAAFIIIATLLGLIFNKRITAGLEAMGIDDPFSTGASVSSAALGSGILDCCVF